MKIKCSCSRIYQIKPEFAGKKLKCKSCDRVFVVPKPTAKPTNSAKPESRQRAAKNLAGASQGYWVKPGQGQVPENPQRSKLIKRNEKKTKRKTADREQALLDEYAGDSLESRMSKRRQDRIEDGRVGNGIVMILKGCGWLLGAVVAFAIFHAIDQGEYSLTVGRRRGIFLLLYYLKGKYWVPPILALLGLYNILIGAGSLSGKVDIDDQFDLPSD